MDQLGQKKSIPLVYRIVARNLRHRLARTILTALAISIGGTLMLTIVGLRDGMLDDQQARAYGAGADIWILPAGVNVIGFSSAPLSEKLVDLVARQPHVEIATGAIMQSIGGVNRITGIDYAAFDRMAGGFRYLEGGPFQNPDDILIDEFYARQRNLHTGDTIAMLDRDWRVCGVVEPGKMARLMLPIEVVQQLTGTTGKLSMIYVKLDDPALTYDVISQLQDVMGTEDYSMYSVEEYASLFSPGAVPQVQIFINVIIALAVAFGFLVVFLTMHTAVLERTREIGILKSLGAAQGYILGILVREALVLGLLGAILGIIFSFGTKFIIGSYVPSDLQASIVPGWWPISIGVTLFGALVGALYPAMKASRQDALESLAYE